MSTEPEPGLSPAESRDLRRVAGLMIPASEQFRVPGADDPLIFADIMRSLGRDLDEVRVALDALAPLSDGNFAGLDDHSAGAAAVSVLTRGDRAAAALGRVILQCYYRDDRVLTALGHEARAPFPKGHTLEQGDWSLLSPVQSRHQLWRDDRRA